MIKIIIIIIITTIINAIVINNNFHTTTICLWSVQEVLTGKSDQNQRPFLLHNHSYLKIKLQRPKNKNLYDTVINSTRFIYCLLTKRLDA